MSFRTLYHDSVGKRHFSSSIKHGKSIDNEPHNMFKKNKVLNAKSSCIKRHNGVQCRPDLYKTANVVLIFCNIIPTCRI